MTHYVEKIYEKLASQYDLPLKFVLHLIIIHYSDVIELNVFLTYDSNAGKIYI